MKTTLRTLVFAAFLISAGKALAQPGFSETITSFAENKNQPSGNDFFFAPIQNDIDEAGKYIQIYIASLVNTTAFIEFDSVIESVSVSAGSVTTYNVPLTWELKSSGVVENKAIHVYSADA